MGAELACGKVSTHRNTTTDDQSIIVYIRGADFGSNRALYEAATTLKKK